MKRFITAVLCLLLLVGCGTKSADVHDANYYEPGYRTEEDSYGLSADESYNVINKNSNSAIAKPEEKLVYRSSVTLETKDYTSLLDELNEIIRRYDGVTQTMRESNTARRTFSLTVRIPSEHFDDFIRSLRKSSGSMTDIYTSVDNITKQYNDNDLRIAALETQHTRLLQLLADAKDLNDVILIESRLSDVETELTRLQSYKNSMDSDVAYSTIDLTVCEVQTYSETSFWSKMTNAISGSLSNFTDNMEGLVIWVIYALPNLAVLAAAYFLLRKPAGKLINNIFRGKKKEAAAVKAE